MTAIIIPPRGIPRPGLAGARDGAVSVEFAIVLPLLFAIFLAIVTFAQAIAVSGKVSAAAGSMVDLIARSKTVDTAALNGVVVAGQQILYPNQAGTPVFGGRIVCVTFKGASAPFTAQIAWEYDFGVHQGAAPDLASLTALAQAGVDVILVSVQYGYVPSVQNPFFSTLTMTRTAVSRPRITSTVQRS
jgi:Flp pilus assembly protein TadG